MDGHVVYRIENDIGLENVSLMRTPTSMYWNTPSNSCTSHKVTNQKAFSWDDLNQGRGECEQSMNRSGD